MKLISQLSALLLTSLLALNVAADPVVLPLEGGNNFRDMGGYPTLDGREVLPNKLFRSGVMTQLTADDMALLNEIGFASVVDLRSSDELSLYPNHWAKQNEINYFSVDYSLISGMRELAQSGVEPKDMMPLFYAQMPELLAPQLTILFDQLIAGHAPLVLNCSAGQDRTGLASALILTALGVPRNIVAEDYLASTKYRDPEIELGDVDLVEAAKTNGFAAMMLSYSHESSAPQPLLTEDLRPYLSFSFAQMEQDYGSVLGYLEQRLGVDAADLERLQELYLTDI